jgi:hypothetical protein
MGKGSTPTKSSNNGFRITFVDLGEGEAPPEVALYSIDDDGKPTAKLGTAAKGMVPYPLSSLKKGGRVAIGPDVAKPAELTPERLLVYRVDEIADVWAGQGLVLPRARWDDVFYPMFRCVTGRVRKCRPFWWDIITEARPIATKGIKYSRALALHDQAISQVNAATIAGGVRSFPWRCVPICQGRVDIYERQCCCVSIVVSDLIDRIRVVLERVPIHWPPIPEPDPPPYRALGQQVVRKVAPSSVGTEFDMSEAPPRRLYDAYQELRRLPPLEAERYVRERVWLYPFTCDCTIKKVGRVSIQPDGSFHLCYPRRRPPIGCYLTYSYRVQQFLNGFWTTVYNGPAAGDWFSAGEEADIRVVNPIAVPCEDLGDPPPPNETGLPVIMLDYVGKFGTNHFRYPDQTEFNRFGSIGGNDGLYTYQGVSDCPWAGSLALFLHFTPELSPIARYYRLSVVGVDSNGTQVGQPVPLKASISWPWIDSSTSEGSSDLGPRTVGTEMNLYLIPYGKNAINNTDPDYHLYHYWRHGWPYQVWDTTPYSGKYMLILEVFDASGNKVRPNNNLPNSGPGTKRNFTFLRWENATETKPVPFSDCAHIFWIDQVPIVGDIVDLRKNGQPNTAECQYMTGNDEDEFSIGYKAYHIGGMSDDNSFMRTHSIEWQRGLNGAVGTLAPETSPTTNAGRYATAQSGSATFDYMLNKDKLVGKNVKCTFSVTLNVWAKHFNGADFLTDPAHHYYETASFALNVGPPVGGP